jgi:hypothetical protein
LQKRNREGILRIVEARMRRGDAAAAEFLRAYGADARVGAREEEAQPWDADDWDEVQVPAGDARLVEDDEGESKPGHLQESDAEFAAAVVGLCRDIHPNLSVSRNTQVTCRYTVIINC